MKECSEKKRHFCDVWPKNKKVCSAFGTRVSGWSWTKGGCVNPTFANTKRHVLQLILHIKFGFPALSTKGSVRSEKLYFLCIAFPNYSFTDQLFGMASAEELGDLFGNLPAGEKRKFLRQLSSVRAKDEGQHGIALAAPKKAVNGFMAFRCEFSYVIPRH